MRDSFKKYLENHPKWASFMYGVKDLEKDTIPFLFAKCSLTYCGDNKELKAKLANLALVDFLTSLKKQNSIDGCPYYQPNSQSTMTRTLLAAMSDEYGWHFSIDDDFNFVGGVKKVLSMLYQRRSMVYANVSFSCFMSYLAQLQLT